MAATIITNFAGGFEYEPEIITDNSRDGITVFQFKIIGFLSSLRQQFEIEQQIIGVPDQPPGNYKVVRRNLEHIAGDQVTGLYRLSVTGEGGTGDTSLFISETSYAMQNQQQDGTIDLPLAQIPAIYNLIWLYPSATITTNSRNESPKSAESIARKIVDGLNTTIIKDKPTNVTGVGLSNNSELNKTYISGSSVEKAGALYRIRATASKGLYIK